MKAKKSKKSVTKQTAKQKDRAKHRCDPKVKELIDLVNSIPPDRELPPPDELGIRDPEDGHMAEGQPDYDRIRQLLEGVPDEPFRDIYAWCFMDDSYAAPFRDDQCTRPEIEMSDTAGCEWAERTYQRLKYEYFRILREQVRGLAQLARMTPEARTLFNDPFFYYADLVELPDEWEISDNERNARAGRWRWPRIEIEIKINAEGKFVAREYALLTPLIGCEAARLRECAICQSIFWARQDNMKACSTSCSNANRQRAFRENHAQYEGARKKKRRSAKAGSR